MTLLIYTVQSLNDIVLLFSFLSFFFLLFFLCVCGGVGVGGVKTLIA